MSNWDRNYSNGSYFNNWHGRLVYNLNSQNVGANTSNISLTLQTFADSGAYSQNGSWDPRIYINGGLVAAPGGSHSIGGSTPFTLASWSGDVGHDANGNWSGSIGDYINAPINEMTYDAIGWTLPRLPLAPSIAGNTVDQITPKSARLGTEISSYGHGTSAACRFYYRIQGIGSYTATGDQTDVAGYNYFNITGLKPGKTYEYYSYWYNNNGDVSTSGVSTFKTKGIASMVPLLTSLAS
jgi:hypothetical protein